MSQELPIVSKLIKGNIEMITACFDEYFFMIPEGVIKPVTKNAGVFKLEIHYLCGERPMNSHPALTSLTFIR